jgi:NADPH:quinone reductase
MPGTQADDCDRVLPGRDTVTPLESSIFTEQVWHRRRDVAGPFAAAPLASVRPMRAVVCHELGPPSLLRVEERPDPDPGATGVVVEVEAAGVNYVDALFVAGKYQIKPQVPFVPGTESAGHVIGAGPEVSGLAVGQRVLVSAGLGGYASRVMARPASVTRIPDVLDAPRAATFTQSYSTSLFALRERAGVRPGERVLVLGAGGGVGLAAIGVAKALGCRALGVASSAAKREAALAAGAEAVLDPVSEPVKDAARAWAGGTGVDVVLDPIGGELAQPSLRALGDGGRYLVIGFASGEIPTLPLNQVLLRNRSVIGIDWGIWAMTHADAQRTLLADLLAMVAQGRLDPVRPAEYPLEDVARALEDLLERRTVGKIALIP